MNREQRRAQLHTKPARQELKSISYGHNGELVIIQFPVMAKNISLTEEQADAMIEALQATKRQLIEHKRAEAARRGN